MKCPVCEKQIESSMQKCPNCGFVDLRTEFINENELEMWQTYVVYPCRFAYQTSVAQTQELERKFQEELSEIRKVHNDIQESGGVTSSEPLLFKKLTLNKNENWITKGNITYKNFYKCSWCETTECEVTNLTLNVTGNNAMITFFAKKVYDEWGDDSAELIGFKWKLKDDYGIIVNDGSWSNDALQVGDVTKGSISIKGLNHSVKYVLELVNDD